MTHNTPDSSSSKDSSAAFSAAEAQSQRAITPQGSDAGSSYDAVPYPSHPFRKTHPDQLYTMGRLFSVDPTPPDRCRVLEIGCAGGGNLLPMADQLPEAKFLGIDYSDVQIQDAQRTIDSAGLKNVRVLQADISQVDAAALGKFDYIICHGVYSWVPPQVQDAILDVCSRCLNPHGIAFVSFNTYPGWHFRGMIRDMMQYHVRQFRRAEVQIKQARALLAFLAENVDGDTAYGKLLKDELEMLGRRSDSYLFHEHLESHNQPVYFHVFAESVRRYRLLYLGDVDIVTMWLGNFAGSVTDTLQRISPELIHQEQYADFLRNRMFRQAMLCHEHIRPDRHISVDKILEARFRGELRFETEGQDPDLRPGVSQRFVEPSSHASIETNLALVKAALYELGRVFPRSLSLKELWEYALSATDLAPAKDPATAGAFHRRFCEELLKLFVSGLIEIRFTTDRFVSEISETPCVSPLTLVQARNGGPLTSRRHELIGLDKIALELAELLDGTRTRDMLVDELLSRATNGRSPAAAVPRTTSELPQADRRASAAANVNILLEQLARKALLTG